MGFLLAVAFLTSLLSAPESDFNEKVVEAINETIHELLGKTVLVTLHGHLIRHYSLTADEIPYHLDTLSEALESVFGVVGAKTIEWSIARKFYSRIGLLFVENENFTLQDYSNQAKKEL